MLIFGFFCSATKETRRRSGGTTPSRPAGRNSPNHKKRRMHSILRFHYNIRLCRQRSERHLLLQPSFQLADGHTHLHSHKKLAFCGTPKLLKSSGEMNSPLRKFSLRSNFVRRQGGGMEQVGRCGIRTPSSPPAKLSAR